MRDDLCGCLQNNFSLSLIIMECPRCKNEGLTDDDKVFEHVFKFFCKNANPFSPLKSICNMGMGLFNVGRTIYYDFSSIKQTDEYFWCPICDHYFIECPHCYHLNGNRQGYNDITPKNSM